MKSKIIAFLLIMVMAVGIVGCGGGNDGGGSDAKEPATEQDASDDGGEGAEVSSEGENSLTVWCWDQAFNIAAMEEAGNVYKKDNPDFELNVVETPWDDVQTKLTTAANSGDLSTLPDIFLMQDNAFQKNVMSYPEVFTPLTDSGINFSDFGGAKVAYSTVDGVNYGVPFDNGTVVAVYRNDMLEEAGLTVDDFTDITWTEYIENGKKVLEATGKPLLSAVAGESDLAAMVLQSAGSSMFNDDGTANLVGNPELEELTEVYKEMADAGILLLANDWNGYVETITNKNVAGTINGCWILGTVQTIEDESGNWSLTNMPKLEKAANATNYSNNGGSSWAVTSNSGNPELAFDFLAKTFAGSVEFYETILPSTGALASYLPAGESDVYGEPQEFFGGDAIYSKITEFAGNVPSNITGAYYYEARDAVAIALTNIINGADAESEIQAAEENLNFSMGN